jgi:hypothetical protein
MSVRQQHSKVLVKPCLLGCNADYLPIQGTPNEPQDTPRSKRG